MINVWVSLMDAEEQRRSHDLTCEIFHSVDQLFPVSSGVARGVRRGAGRPGHQFCCSFGWATISMLLLMMMMAGQGPPRQQKAVGTPLAVVQFL